MSTMNTICSTSSSVFFLNMIILIMSGLVMMGNIWVAAGTPPAAPAPGVDCTTLVLNLADCLSFVSAGSAVEKPEGTCCPGLKMVLKSHAECLCEAFKNSAQFGVTLNVSKALTLPSACHISAPSISNCGLSLAAGAAPGSAPVGAVSPSTTSGAPSSVAGLNEAGAPVPGPAGSGSAALGFSVGSILISLVAVAFSSL